MRTTLDFGRKKQCAVFVDDTMHGVMVECPHCSEHQDIIEVAGPKNKPYVCANVSCGKEIFYPGWAEW